MFKRIIATVAVVGALLGASTAVAPVASAGSTQEDCCRRLVYNMTRLLLP